MKSNRRSRQTPRKGAPVARVRSGPTAGPPKQEITERVRILPAKFAPERDDTKRTADLLSRELTVRTHEDVVAYLGMSQVGRGFPAPMITSLERHPWGPETVILRATMRVRDRDKGTALDVTATESLMLPISNFELLHRHISLLERLLKHELMENFYVAGRRILDPHK